MDFLLLSNIEVWTKIGVPEEERTKPQRLLVTIELLHPLADVAKSDDVKDGIDYVTVTEVIRELAKTERKTVERFAEDCADVVLKTCKPKGGVKVSVTKHPLLPLESVTVTIERP